MSTNTPPADFRPSSFRVQLRRATLSLYKNLQAAVRAYGTAAPSGEGSFSVRWFRAPEMSADAQPRRRESIRRCVRWTLQNVAAGLRAGKTDVPAGDPHFLAFCAAVAEMLISA